jgi:hypothetical protein
MDWKSYYQNELTSTEGQAFVHRCFQRHRQGDPQIARVLEAQGIISFPHTSIYYTGESFARLISTLCQIKMEKIIALGVLHGAKLPGAFIPTTPIETSFGMIPRHPVVQRTKTNDELLANEFSLDAFLSLNALYAREQGLRPLSILSLYIGLTRDLAGSFAIATQIAQWLREIVDERTGSLPPATSCTTARPTARRRRWPASQQIRAS